MISKEAIVKACLAEINTRISNTQSAIDSARESANNEQKSTAGDKHDTARSMAQLEQEKLGFQLAQHQKMLQALKQIDASITGDTVRLGSLIKCSNGLFFMSVGLGKISVQGQSVFCISRLSPLGDVLWAKTAGEQIEVQKKSIDILEVS